MFTICAEGLSGCSALLCAPRRRRHFSRRRPARRPRDARLPVSGRMTPATPRGISCCSRHAAAAHATRRLPLHRHFRVAADAGQHQLLARAAALKPPILTRASLLSPGHQRIAEFASQALAASTIPLATPFTARAELPAGTGSHVLLSRAFKTILSLRHFFIEDAHWFLHIAAHRAEHIMMPRISI